MGTKWQPSDWQGPDGYYSERYYRQERLKETIVELKDVRKDFVKGPITIRALQGIDLAIEQGELVSIEGPSGSGKTTLMNIIGCVYCPTEGTVKIHRQEVGPRTRRELVRCRRTIGLISFGDGLSTRLTVRKALESQLRRIPENRSYAEVLERVQTLVDSVGLAKQIDNRLSELSRGQRTRMAIARAIAMRPTIVLADELMAGVDSGTGAAILELIKNLNKDEKTTFVFFTHDATTLECATRVVRIRDGLIVG